MTFAALGGLYLTLPPPDIYAYNQTWTQGEGLGHVSPLALENFTPPLLWSRQRPKIPPLAEALLNQLAKTAITANLFGRLRRLVRGTYTSVGPWGALRSVSTT